MSFPLCYFIATNKIFTKGKYINSCYLLCILILTKDADGFDLKFLGLYLSKNKFPSNVVWLSIGTIKEGIKLSDMCATILEKVYSTDDLLRGKGIYVDQKTQ